MEELIPVIPLVDVEHRTNRHQRTVATSNRDVPQKSVSFETNNGKKRVSPNVSVLPSKLFE